MIWKLEMMVIKCIQNSPFKPDITLTIIILTRNIIEINYERIKWLLIYVAMSRGIMVDGR